MDLLEEFEEDEKTKALCKYIDTLIEEVRLEPLYYSKAYKSLHVLEVSDHTFFQSFCQAVLGECFAPLYTETILQLASVVPNKRDLFINSYRRVSRDITSTDSSKLIPAAMAHIDPEFLEKIVSLVNKYYGPIFRRDREAFNIIDVTCFITIMSQFNEEDSFLVEGALKCLPAGTEIATFLHEVRDVPTPLYKEIATRIKSTDRLLLRASVEAAWKQLPEYLIKPFLEAE